MRGAGGGDAADGCWPGARHPRPWVKPYEREHFADPIMSFTRNPVSSTYLDHVFESREGARGATGARRRRLRMQLSASARATRGVSGR